MSSATNAALDQENLLLLEFHQACSSNLGEGRGGGEKGVPHHVHGGVGCSGGARMINGSSLGVLYLSRNYFHASRKDKSICQVGSKLRRSYRAGCTPLKTREEM